VVEREVVREGQQAVRIEHTGTEDWSFAQAKRMDVEPGEIYEFSAWVRLEGRGTATLGVVLYDKAGKVLDWAFGGRTTGATGDWQRLRTRFVIPHDAAQMWPRLTGFGPATVWMDGAVLVQRGSVEQMRRGPLPARVQAANRWLELSFHPEKLRFTAVDRRTGRRWEGHAGKGLVVLDASATDGGFQLRLLEPAELLEVTATVRLEPDRSEWVIQLEAKGTLPQPLRFPPPFATRPGMLLIMPVNEGISYPADDASLSPMYYHLYGGHGLCMAWYGMTDGEQGLMAIVETPDDAAVRVPRVEGMLCLAPEWQAQHGQFGPLRKIRYVLFDQGGYVAMCKRYRQYARQIGLLKTLAEKRKENPHVDFLVGAVNVWCWSPDPVSVCRRLQDLGIERILWSHRATPDQIARMNAMGVLTSRYDIYQDVMNPANFPKLRGVHPDWTTEAWPDDLMVDENGQWRRGWRVRGKDGQWYPCGVLCDRRAVDYARRRIPPELKTHPYRCRFIDTTTASPWRECYHPDHPMTRSQSRHWKMELLRFVGQTCGLVTGSETGHDAAVPYVHYFEGMMSLGPYRVPDAGRRMMEPWYEVPERVAKFQTGHYYRLPLWELVYHDCVVSYWYWGDYNNKLPPLWDRRDLWNALYGTPPMFMFNEKIWQEYRDRFVQSYRTATPVARATGYSEMLTHRWLTDDHAVQQTSFANGVTATVNFGDKPFTMPDGTVLEPLGHRVVGLD